MMNIFDFVPSHLWANQDRNRTEVDAKNAASMSTHSSLSKMPESFMLSSVTKLEQYTLMLQEWEQTCYSEWVEMEQDISLFSLHCGE